MITDEAVRQLFQNCRKHLNEFWQINSFHQVPSQFWRGATAALGKKASSAYCRRNKLVFKTFNIIPKYCFNCYKIEIKPGNVVELFKLLIVLERLDLPNDNPRKCMVEARPQVSGTYKGFIYARSLKDARFILKKIKAIIHTDISKKVSVTLKRGCTEFALAHPGFAKIDKKFKPVMRYKDEWQVYEDLAEQTNMGAQFKPVPEDYNQPGLILNDAVIMLNWLKYAATIGDLSYQGITDEPLPKLQDLDRPSFQLVEEGDKG